MPTIESVPVVVALKTKSDKASLITFAYQLSTLVTKCVHSDFAVSDFVVTFGGTKDVLRELKKIDAKKRFEYVIVYSPKQIAQSAEEFDDFIAQVKSLYKSDVLWLRSG